MKAHELKGCLLVIIGITLVSELLGLTGLTTSPHRELHRILFSDTSIFLVGGITVHSFLMKVFSPAGRNELILILLACIFFSFFYFVFNDVSRLPYWYLSGVPQAGLGVASFCIIFYKAIFAAGDDRNINRALLIGSACIFLVALNIECYLQLTSAIHPLVYDPSAYKFDLSLGANFSSYIAVLLNTHPLLRSVTVLAYFLVPYGFSVLFGLYVSSPDKVPVNILFVIFTSMFCAYLFYHITPAAGPQYAFGKLFPLAMPSAAEINSAYSVIAPAPRNAIPSMHFGWTFIMWVISLRYNFVVRTAFGLLMIFNIFATLGLGEHYLIDLIIAIPFMLFVFAFCRKSLKEQDALRNQAFLAGIIITVLWCVYIRAGNEYFNIIPGLSWLLVLATMLSSYRYYSLLTSPEFDKYGNRFPGIIDKVATQGFNVATLVVCFVFFFSGFAALVYQVLFSKVLSYTFGSNSSAVYTVLATYMGGMAIGAWLGGKIVLLGKPPLKVYAIIETVIALYCLLSPSVFRLTQYFYSFIGAGMLPGQPGLDVLRFLLGVLVLLVPTILMGMTLPVLISHFRARKQAYGSSIAKLYSANTIGAATGALVSGYLIIPVFGINNTIHLAVWINLLAAGIAYIYSNKQGFIQFTGNDDGASAASSYLQSAKNSLIWTGSGYVAVFVVGIISLGLEVIYIHMLSIVAGNSVYAFSLMLFTFLLGLGAGSEMARQIMKQNINVSYLISLLTIILTITVFTGVFIWDVIPGYFASFAYYPLARTFVEREFIRGLVCFVCMFPPAVIIGCLYPSCLQHVADLAKGPGIGAVSRAIAINTVGNILGVLLAGFILLPGPGALNSLRILAFLALLICIYFSWFSLPRQRIVTGLLMVVAVFIFICLPGSFDYNNLATGANVYFKAQNFGEVIDHQESLDGGLTTVHTYKISDSRTIKTLLTNGKFQGTDDKSGEMIPQLGYAHPQGAGHSLLAMVPVLLQVYCMMPGLRNWM